MATFSDQAIFGESCSRAGESSNNKVAGSPKLHKTLIKSDLACEPVLGHTFFEKKMEVLINMNDFLSILGSARGAHRGSNEPCSPVLKTLLGPNGPKNHPKAPQGSPRLQKSPGNINFLRFLCGVLTSFVISFWHAIPWQRSKHHKTKQQLR